MLSVFDVLYAQGMGLTEKQAHGDNFLVFLYSLQ